MKTKRIEIVPIRPFEGLIAFTTVCELLGYSLLTSCEFEKFAIIQEMESHAKADESFHVTANMVLSLAQRSKKIFESSEVDEKRQLLNFIFQNLDLKDKKLSVTLLEPFKIIKDTSQLEKCPEMCRSQDSFRTFKEFDWSSIRISIKNFTVL